MYKKKEQPIYKSSLYFVKDPKHPELELDWGFFEKVRTKRNGISYYGNPVGEKDWKEVELQFQLYIKLLQKKIREKIKER